MLLRAVWWRQSEAETVYRLVRSSLRVNTSVIDMPETWWQGLYFPDYPVEIAVEEVYGDNAFLGWYTESGELLSTDEVIMLDLGEEVNIINARFETD